MKKHLNIKIIGKVQGVFFRASAKSKAGELDISGYAENLPDGSVRVEAEGEEKYLEKFLDWCGKGPAGAGVENLSYEYSDDLKEYEGFEIK